MFNFEITPLGNLFFGLSLIVFISLIFVKNSKRDIRLHTLLLSALGFIFYANDLITLFIGWEVMSWSSYFIISKNAKANTLQKYIIFNLGAGFSLLAAISLIYGFSGSVIYSDIDFSQIPTNLHTPISILLLITIFIKSGVVPFHHWVVDTYEESNHVFSAILSAIISKAGIFLFIMMFTQIIGYKLLEDRVFDIVAWFGVITSIIATFKAISKDEIKRLLAYSSIAQLGYIITVLAVLNGSGVEAGLYHTLIHTFVKLLLFINIASIIYITGKNKFSELGGLLYQYPTLFILLLIGVIALAGMPPLGGFSSKFLIYTTLLEEQKGLLLSAVMFSSASAFLYCYKLIYGIYLGQPTHEKSEFKKLPMTFYIPQFVGAIILVVLGFLPSLGIALFNPILASLGLDISSYQSLFELNSSFASFNGGVLMALFCTVFALLLIAFISMKNRARDVRDRFDISYCGEVPDKDINLHYGYGMGKELNRISFIKVILENSSNVFWKRWSTITKDSSIFLKKLYSLSSDHVGLLIIIFFIVLLFVGGKS